MVPWKEKEQKCQICLKLKKIIYIFQIACEGSNYSSFHIREKKGSNNKFTFTINKHSTTYNNIQFNHWCLTTFNEWKKQRTECLSDYSIICLMKCLHIGDTWSGIIFWRRSRTFGSLTTDGNCKLTWRKTILLQLQQPLKKIQTKTDLFIFFCNK